MDCANNSNIAGATQQGFKPSVTGSYKVALSYLDCQDTSACEQITIAGISELADWGVEVYPNPSTTNFVINNGGAKPLEFQIVNISGQILENGQLGKNQKITVGKHLEPGLYLLRLSQEKQQVSYQLLKH